MEAADGATTATAVSRDGAAGQIMVNSAMVLTGGAEIVLTDGAPVRLVRFGRGGVPSDCNGPHGDSIARQLMEHQPQGRGNYLI